MSRGSPQGFARRRSLGHDGADYARSTLRLANHNDQNEGPIFQRARGMIHPESGLKGRVIAAGDSVEPGVGGCDDSHLRRRVCHTRPCSHSDEDDKLLCGSLTARRGPFIALTMESRYRIGVVQDATSIETHLTSLRKLLQHCVNDEPAMSSIGFLAPLSDHNAVEHWLQFLRPSSLRMQTPYSSSQPRSPAMRLWPRCRSSGWSRRRTATRAK